MNNRITRAIEILKQQSLEGLFVTSDLNRRYLSGFTGSAGAVLITQTELTIFVDGRYTEQAKAEAQGFSVQSVDKIREYCQACATIGFEEKTVTVSQYDSFRAYGESRWVKASDAVDALRSVKEASELHIMRQAATLCDDVFTELLGFIKVGVTEKQLKIILETEIIKRGAEKLSFDPIVVSGKRTALPHGRPTDKEIRIGELVTFDFGAVVDGYCSDMTRTVGVGHLSDKQQMIYETVRQAQQEAVDNIKPHMSAKEADAVARSVIEKAGYGKHFSHGLGHGVGQYIHEMPRVSDKSDEILLPHMVITIEPGIYLEGEFGVRIEDIGVITETGFESFSKSPKQLMVV